MRYTLLGILGLFIAFVAPTVWERMMDAAPEPMWRIVLCLFALSAIAFVVLSDPVYLKLTKPAQHPWLSTAIVAIVSAAVAGSVWWFFVTTTTEPEQAAIVPTPPATIREGLNVGEIRFIFDDLKKDRHSELIMRVFNGTGNVVEFSSLQGQVTFSDADNTDPDRMGTLPTPALRADTQRTVAPSKEWFLILNQRVPAVEADKLQKLIESDIQIHFDLRELTIEVVGGHDRKKVERIPLWGGVTYSRGSGFLRKIYGAG